MILSLKIGLIHAYTAQSYTKFQFSHGIPEGCAQAECDYFVGINPSSDENLLEFTLEGNAKGWVAIGFSKTPSMVCAYATVWLNVRL